MPSHKPKTIHNIEDLRARWVEMLDSDDPGLRAESHVSSRVTEAFIIAIHTKPDDIPQDKFVYAIVRVLASLYASNLAATSASENIHDNNVELKLYLEQALDAAVEAVELAFGAGETLQ